MEKVTLIWKGEKKLVLANGISLETLNAKAAMLYALARCASLTVIALLNKMQVNVTGLSIEVTGELTGEVTSSDVVYKWFAEKMMIESSDGEMAEAKIIRAVELTNNKYCGVGLMYSKIAPIKYQLTINGKTIEMPHI